MECPKCHSTMEEVTFGRNMVIDRCTNCKGIWFDAGEAETLKGKWMSEFIDSGDPEVEENTIKSKMSIAPGVANAC